MTTVARAIDEHVNDMLYRPEFLPTGATIAEALGIDPELDIDVLRRRLLIGERAESMEPMQPNSHSRDDWFGAFGWNAARHHLTRPETDERPPGSPTANETTPEGTDTAPQTEETE